MFDICNGVERVRAWPKKRGKNLQQKTKDQNSKFANCSWAIKFLPAIVQAQAMEATKGLPLLPRDVLMQQLYGRFCAVKLPDGRVIYPMVARQDISESLDILSQVPGTILVRGEQFWFGLEPGDPGDVLSVDGATGLPAYILNSAVGSLVVIDEQVLSATASSVIFDPIPGTNRDLILSISARCTGTGNNNNASMRFNGDTGAHYDSSPWARTGATAPVNQTSVRLMGSLGATHIANDFTSIDCTIWRYAATDRNKKFFIWESVDLSTPDPYGINTMGNWKQTNAITKIECFPGAGSWDVGSIFTLYGRG